MKKILSKIALCVLCVASLASCSKNDGNNDTIMQYGFPSCFARVYDSATGVTTYLPNVNYTMTMNVTASTAEISITGLTLPGQTAYPQIDITGLKVESRGLWAEVKASRPDVSIAGFGTIPSIRNFELDILDRVMGTSYVPGLAIDYVVDDRYRVFSGAPGQVLLGETVSTSSEDGKAFTNNEALIGLVLDVKNMTLQVELANAQFIMGMPAQDIFLNDIPFTMDEDGDVSFSIDALIPCLADNTPFPAFPVSDLSGKFNFTDGIDFTFTCSYRGTPYIITTKAQF